MAAMNVGDRVLIPNKTTYDYNVEVFQNGRFNQLMQQSILKDFSDTDIHKIREQKRVGTIIKIEEWGTCPIWYGRNVPWETELCAHVQFDRECQPHIVMLCDLVHNLHFFEDLL